MTSVRHKVTVQRLVNRWRAAARLLRRNEYGPVLTAAEAYESAAEQLAKEAGCSPATTCQDSR